ncbi:hypothetical protein AMTR_s00128p00021190 [Amborella trichopoda]|uniref:Uncharacterized protein n=1 Tax=Amborella trichopoda TaxID=13333 RepID=W1NPX0_AMBTC|nr:hypothetical protein AMTR_s00128p00021190 [Amborella trichopoda]
MEKHERLRAQHLSDQAHLKKEITSLFDEIQVAECEIGELKTRVASLKSRCLWGRRWYVDILIHWSGWAPKRCQSVIWQTYLPRVFSSSRSRGIRPCGVQTS